MVDHKEVELLVMKAMSLQLVKGEIDEVEELVHVNWIQPRYLNKGHLQIMREKLGDWEIKLASVINICEDQIQRSGL